MGHPPARPAMTTVPSAAVSRCLEMVRPAVASRQLAAARVTKGERSRVGEQADEGTGKGGFGRELFWEGELCERNLVALADVGGGWRRRDRKRQAEGRREIVALKNVHSLVFLVVRRDINNSTFFVFDKYCPIMD